MKLWRVPVLAVPWCWLLVFLVAPLAIVVGISFAQPADGIPPYAPVLAWHDGWPILSLDPANYAVLLQDRFYLAALLRSVVVAGLSSLACLLLGYPMALAIARAPAAWRSRLLLLVILPFWTGFLLRVTAWIGLLRDDGWINGALLAVGLIHAPLRLLYTDFAMYVGIVYAYLPFMILPLYARLSKLDPALEAAAGDLGESPVGVFLRVTWPLSRPGVLAGMMLVFIPAVGEYVIPELLGGPGAQTIGRVLWTEFFDNHDWPMASAVAVALLGVLLVPAALLQRSGSRRFDDRGA
ncbi:MAG: ABC transporter permease subunit [Acidisphaera sp.]|nr:ABC transporter permease subunit [Acidisphaera sp.]